MGREARARRLQQAAEKTLAGTGHQESPPRGLPGQDQRLMVRNVFKDGDPRNDLPLAGGPGRYRVLFTLARPGFLPLPEKRFSFDTAIPGDSHLAIAPPALKLPPGNPGATAIKVYTTSEAGEIVFVGHPNARGFLGRLETELDARDLRNAEQKAYRVLAPSLSNWAVHLDIPMHVWRIHVTEVASGAAQIGIINPSDEMPFALAASGSMSPEFRGFASLYREALESNSPVYQFLCLFKIAEGIRNRRGRLATEAKTRGETPTGRPVERVPKARAEFESWLNAIYPLCRAWDAMALDAVFVPAALGRKINDVLDKELTDLRNDVAHALSQSTGGITLSADEALHIARVGQWLPLMKCVVRRMLKNEFPNEFLSYLLEDGTTSE